MAFFEAVFEDNSKDIKARTIAISLDFNCFFEVNIANGNGIINIGLVLNPKRLFPVPLIKRQNSNKSKGVLDRLSPFPFIKRYCYY